MGRDEDEQCTGEERESAVNPQTNLPDGTTNIGGINVNADTVGYLAKHKEREEQRQGSGYSIPGSEFRR